MTAAAQQTVLVVEDHEITRKGLRLILEQRSELKIVGEALNGQQAIEKAFSLHPNVVLMDIGLPLMDGIQAACQIKKGLPQTNIIMLTSHEDKEDIVAAVKAGAAGYCLKDIPLTELLKAINVVVDGGKWFDSRCQRPSFDIDVSPDSKSISLINNNLVERSYSTEDTVQLLEPGIVFQCRYVIEDLIGRGGKGTLYRALDLENNEKVAIKLFPICFDYSPQVSTIQRELSAIAAIDHPNVIGARASGITRQGRPYLVIDYVDGVSLQTILNSGQKLDLKRFQNIFTQVCSALNAVHAAKQIHCDVSPGNIMLTKNQGSESVKLIDFGLVQRAASDLLRDSFQGNDRGPVAGSPYYMSPEQCAGQTLSFSSDIYSLGCVMYKSLTGRNVFEGTTMYELFSKHIKDMPAGMNNGQVNVPRFLENTIFKALNKEPKDRFRSVLELKHYLEIDLDAQSAAQSVTE